MKAAVVAAVDSIVPVSDASERARGQIAEWLTKYLADLTNLAMNEIAPDGTFDRYGIDSYQGVVMMYELGEWLGKEIEPYTAFEHPSVSALSTYLALDASIQARFS